MGTTAQISAIVATRNRSNSFARMLSSLAQQSVQPVELLVVDSSTDDETKRICNTGVRDLLTSIVYHQANQIGAAAQRNQAIGYVSQEFLIFLDDDVLFEHDCIARLWSALESDRWLGGVNAMITNQKYSRPGFVSQTLFHILHGRHESSYAGRCIGPGLNLLPEDNPDLPEVVPVEWLNTTCVLYRREALPHPVFSEHFTGYSMMEDLTLSLLVRKNWNLANARTARIYHDSQPGEHKGSLSLLSKMELVNRHYVMTQVLERKGLSNYLKLLLWEIFGVLSILNLHGGWKLLPTVAWGKLVAVVEIAASAISRLENTPKKL